MSELVMEVVNSLNGMPDDSVRFVLEMIKRLKQPVMIENESTQAGKKMRPLGMFKNEEFVADGYDIDEDNDEIARMFGVME